MALETLHAAAMHFLRSSVVLCRQFDAVTRAPIDHALPVGDDLPTEVLFAVLGGGLVMFLMLLLIGASIFAAAIE